MVSMVPAAITLPSANTAMRSQTVCRLSRSWVTMKTVRPKVRCKVAISVSNSPAPIGSSPEVGSSRKTISGIERQRARQRHALGHAAGQLGREICRRRSASSPTISSLATASSSSSVLRQFEIFAHRELQVFAHGERGKQRALLKQHAPAPLDRLPLRVAGRRHVDAEHLDGARRACGSRPMMVRISTDLPAPEPPTKPRISPR